MFMFLESLHAYSLVAFVVKKNGMLTKVQNVISGWVLSAAIILLVVSMQFDNYGGDYHCWLKVNTTLVFGQMIPTMVIVIVTLTVLEAAGNADYRNLPGMDQEQHYSARIMTRSNLIIMPLVIVSWFIGVMSEYEQNIPLYGIFTLINGILGVTIFLLHCSGNEEVRDKLQELYDSLVKRN